MTLAQDEMSLADAVEDWWDNNIEKIKKKIGRNHWVNEFENAAHGNSDYLQKAVSNALVTKKYDWDTYDIINQNTQDDIAEVLANLAYQDLVNDDEWCTTRWDSFDEQYCNVGSMNRNKKYENVSLTDFDCESLVDKINNLLSKVNAEVDVADDNADYGFINIGVYNPDFVTDYDLIAKDTDLFEVDHEDRSIGKAKSLNEICKLIADHFIKNFSK